MIGKTTRSSYLSSGCLVLLFCLMVICIYPQAASAQPRERTFWFRLSSQVFEPSRTNCIRLADFDRDGDLDAVFSNMALHHSELWLNDGHGFFTKSVHEFTQQGHGIGVGDLDGDEDLDLFFTCAGWAENNTELNKPSKIYLNNGSGTFTDWGQDLGDTQLSGNAIELIDIDSDGDLDAHIAYYKMPDKVYLNNGRGIFTDSHRDYPENPTFGDLDCDGDPDMLVRQKGVGYTTFLNDGEGTFSFHSTLTDSLFQRVKTELGDIDNDGDLDAVVTNLTRETGYPTKVLTNDGNGSFFDSGQQLTPVMHGRCSIGDLNGDGHPDLVITSMRQPNEIWVNDGNGIFLDSGIRLEHHGTFMQPQLADLDNDGDPDLFIPSYFGGSNQIWFNESH